MKYNLLFPKIYVESSSNINATLVSKCLVSILNGFSRLNNCASCSDSYPRIKRFEVDYDALIHELRKTVLDYDEISKICHFNNDPGQIVNIGPLTVLFRILDYHRDKLYDKSYTERLFNQSCVHKDTISLADFYKQLGIDLDDHTRFSSALVGPVENWAYTNISRIYTLFAECGSTPKRQQGGRFMHLMSNKLNIGVNVSHPYVIVHGGLIHDLNSLINNRIISQ